ncbi:hypothetical protein VTI28DRAFT_6967 [Corynascus sepedonium]
MIDIEGAERAWTIRESVNRDPTASDLFANQVIVKIFHVGYGAEGQRDRRLRKTIYNSRIDNVNPELTASAGLITPYSANRWKHQASLYTG